MSGAKFSVELIQGLEGSFEPMVCSPMLGIPGGIPDAAQEAHGCGGPADSLD